MGAPVSREHWLDRLAASQTRRQVLKAALAGAALTLPFASGARGAATANPNACRKGCNYTAHKKFLQQSDRCTASYLPSVGVSFFVLGFAHISTAAGVAGAIECFDRALVTQKARFYDCLQPDCSGFDPKAKDGPCEGVVGLCCPCESCTQGYVPCAQCCNPNGDGCGSGVTQCGGGP